MKDRKLQKYYILFTVLTLFIAIMSLLNRDHLIGIYLFFAHLFSINPDLVSGENATSISNGGHVICCFLLMWVAYHVFRESYVKAILFVGGLACLVEVSQLFSATRSARFEDILLSFLGILLAVSLIKINSYHLSHIPTQ